MGDCQRIAPMLRQPAPSRDVPVSSGHGPSRHFACAQRSGRFQVKADIRWQAGPAATVANCRVGPGNFTTSLSQIRTGYSRIIRLVPPHEGCRLPLNVGFLPLPVDPTQQR